MPSKKKSNSSASTDVLAKAIERIKLPQSDVHAIQGWLAEQLTAHQFAKLGQGGHTSTQIPLRQVFVDLPTSGNQNTTTQDARIPFLASLLSSGGMDIAVALNFRHDISTGKKASSDIDDLDAIPSAHRDEFAASASERWAAVLLIGGPGQGKSTLGQLACQLHRAALLAPITSKLDSLHRELVTSFSNNQSAASSSAGQHFLDVKFDPAFPLQISLPEVAAWLNVSDNKAEKIGGFPAFIRFITGLPSAREIGLTSEALSALLMVMPSLIVLDGFDEVGATQDRERIVAATRELFLMLSKGTASVQVLATTRPQGYADELSQVGIRFRKRYLVPLVKVEALEYAKKLIEAKLEGADQRQKALTQIHEAANEVSTQRLLTTPLQVTILAALVQQLGRAPKERWNLFYRYFGYTYDREIERNTYASALLAAHRTHIERVHARVGLLLQVEAERDGGASARMTRARLEQVIDAVLQEDEVSDIERLVLVREIATAAENRLVFLVEPEPGAFGFEIRSLQEFMAAWALTSGRDSEVEARLHQVAKAPMFRNTLLFAASRLFAEGSPLRDILADRICVALDQDQTDRLSTLAKSGAILALEILEEGAALTQPKRAKALMQRAINILSLPAASEQARLARLVNDDTRYIMQAATEGIFLEGSEASKEAAWVCIVDAANREQNWAVELGERFWSPSVATQGFFAGLARANLALGAWISKKIEGDSDAIQPHLFIENQGRVGARTREDSSKNWVAWLSSVFSYERQYDLDYSRVGVLFVGHKRSAAGLKMPSISYPGAKSWLAWQAAAEFEMRPSADSLSIALLAIADGLLKREWYAVRWKSSWPLACCLETASNDTELRNIATLIKSGGLGDLAVWESAQRKWRGHLNLKTALLHLKVDTPWDVESISITPPLLSVPPWTYIGQARRAAVVRPKRAVASLLEVAAALFENAKVGAFRERLAELCVYLWRNLPIRDGSRDWPVTIWIDSFEGAAALLVPKPAFLEVEVWLTLLGKCRGEPNIYMSERVGDYFDALEQAPLDPVLLHMVALAASYADNLRESEELANRVRRIIMECADLHSVPIPARGHIIFLSIVLGVLRAADEKYIYEAIELGGGDWRVEYGWVFEALKMSSLPSSRIEAIATRLFTVFPLRSDEAFASMRLIWDLLQKRTSDLDVPGVWNRLVLPLPHPRQRAEVQERTGIPTKPVWLESLEVREIGGIETLKLSFGVPQQEEGQWIVLLGPNGVGKTTLLRSIVLATRSVRHPSIWPRGSFSSNWRRIHSDTVTSDTVDSSISIRLVTGEENRTVIRPGDSINISQSPEQDRKRIFPIFAYGCRRGSALGGAARQVNLADDDGPEIATLFDDGADLIQAETWLIALDGDSHKNHRSKMVLDIVISALVELLGVESIFIAEQRLWVKEKERSRIPFAALSDGFLTNAGWFLDLMARWVHLVEESGANLADNFLSSMRGLVLIDEIDLHLHPSWQMEIISRVRRLLPQMSFVVTTHNPLTLVGADPDEIWIITRTDLGVRATRGVDKPMLLSGGQIYKEYFGIGDIYPNGVGRVLRRYGYLSGYAYRTDEEQVELDALFEVLRNAGLNPDWEVVPRVENV